VKIPRDKSTFDSYSPLARNSEQQWLGCARLPLWAAFAAFHTQNIG